MPKFCGRSGNTEKGCNSQRPDHSGPHPKATQPTPKAPQLPQTASQVLNQMFTLRRLWGTFPRSHHHIHPSLYYLTMTSKAKSQCWQFYRVIACVSLLAIVNLLLCLTCKLNDRKYVCIGKKSVYTRIGMLVSGLRCLGYIFCGLKENILDWVNYKQQTLLSQSSGGLEIQE